MGAVWNREVPLPRVQFNPEEKTRALCEGLGGR